jgi:iron complex outermembrane receptor protein
VLRILRIRSFAVAAVATASIALSGITVAESTRQFDVPAGDLASALELLSKQAGVEFMYSSEQVRGLKTAGVHGALTAAEAVGRLLEGTKLRLKIHETGALWISEGRDERKSAADSGGTGVGEPAGRFRLAQAKDPENQSPSESSGTQQKIGPDVSAEASDENSQGMPEVLVAGSRLLNMDVVRTQNDPQPYRILDSETIERSSAVSVEEFLKRNLTANTLVQGNGQFNANADGNSSSVNLRGLGTESTVILINGRRAVGASSFGSNLQPDLNTVPLAAIERIEVLPASASAIYGGAAMGGVVNVVLKQNYTGGEARVRYENTTEANAPIRGADFTYGASLEDGRTNLLFAAHYSDSDSLVNADRPQLMQAGIARVMQNNPALLYSPTNPFHVGTTPNISSADGSNLTLRDGTALGSPFTHIPAGYSSSSDPGALVGNAGSYNLTLADTAAYRNGLARPIASAPRLTSVMAVARRQMTDKLDLFAEFFHSENYSQAIFNPLFSNYLVPASAPTNPFQQDVRINIPDATQNNPYESEFTSRRAVLGFLYDLPGGWKMEGDYTWNAIDNLLLARFIRLGNALATGAVNPFVDSLAHPLALDPYVANPDGRPYFSAQSYLHDVGLRAVGRLGQLPAGRPVVTLGLGYRKEGMDSGRFTSFSPGAAPTENFDFVYFPQSQDVSSLYTEGLIPLVSAANRMPGVHELDLQLAVRSEQFSTKSRPDSDAFGAVEPDYSRTRYSSTNGTIGLRYGVIDGLQLRASFSTAFLPPTYSQLLPGMLRTTAPVTVIDPRRGNETAFVEYIQGGNSDLDPQETDNFNLGIILEPAFAPGLRISADWFRFNQDNLIISPSILQIVNNENVFPSRVVRAPVAPGDPYGVGPITTVDQTLINGTRAEIEGVDFGLDYVRDTERHGSFRFGAAATVFQHYKVQDSIDSPLLDKVNEVANGGPLKFKANAALIWDLRRWSAGWSSYYFGGYDQYNEGSNLYVLAQGSSRIPSQIYHDLFIGYRIPQSDPSHAGVSALSGVGVQLNIKNVLNDTPPFDAFYSSAAYVSPFGDPRMRSYALSVTKSF